MWIGGDNSGSPSVKNFYWGIISTKSLMKVETWRQSIWKWKIQLKIKLFIWLAMEGKILTWDSLQKRGWEGPGRCPLCKQDSENIIHLFKLCPFAISVWNIVSKDLNLKRCWIGNTLSDCIKNWYEEKTVPTQITTHICWFIWIERNKAIFEESNPSIQAVIYKTLALQNRTSALLKDRLPRDILIIHQKDSALAWFDGATQRDGSLCGAGGVIKTLDATVIRWTFNCGRGTNTRAELLGAWATIMLANHLSLHRIHVLGDSKVVIDWLLNKGRLQVCSVEGWKARIKVL
jgi:hypothetical protein